MTGGSYTGLGTTAPRHWIEIRYQDGRSFCMDAPPNWWQRLWLRFFFGFHWGGRV